MTLRNLFDHLGRPLTLGRELGKGGEGSVFDVAQLPDFVAKVYHNPPPAHQEAKLRAMIGLPTQDLSKVAAWPTATLHDAPGGPIRGILMRKIKDFKEVHFLYSPAHRKVTFPQADWRFLGHTAMNCAAAFDTIHSHGVVIGDVNQSNVFVSAQGLVVLIDCDSYQVQLNGRSYPCEVGIELFTPPELQGRSFRGLVRTPNHDRFGLAVLVFYLLFMNRHPFAGRYLGPGDMPINQAIAQNRFAYSRSARTYQMQTPLHAPPLSIVPPVLVDLFERAFGPASAQPNARPSAAEWVSALKTFVGTLRACASDPGHVYAPHLPNCPWHALMQQGAPNFFVTVAYTRAGRTSSGSSFVLAAVWARIETVSSPNTAYVQPPVPLVNPTPWPASLGRAIPAQPVFPSILTSQPAPPLTLHSGKDGPPKPIPPAILTSPPAPPAKFVGSPRLQKVNVKREQAHKVIGISALVCGVGFLLLCVAVGMLVVVANRGNEATVLALLSAGPLLIFVSFGVWWLVLETKRREVEQLLNKEYEVELAQLKAEASRRLEVWKRQLELRKAEARQHFEQDLGRWRHQVAVFENEARRQREEWERQLAAQKAEARRRYDQEMASWESTAARIKGEAQRRRQAVLDAKQRADAAQQNWAVSARRFATEFESKRTDLRRLRDRHNQLAGEYAVERQQLQARAQELQLNQFLQQVFIDDHKIPQIGTARMAALISFNIESAFDVVAHQVLEVPGFGPELTGRLVQWRQGIEAQFVYNAAAGVPAPVQQALDSKYAQARQQVEAALLSGEQELKSLGAGAESQLRRLHEHIKSCLSQLAQANADITVIPAGL